MTTPQSAEYYCRFNQIHADKALFATVLAANPIGKEVKVEISSAELFEDGSCSMRVIINGRHLSFFHSAVGRIVADGFSADGKTALLEDGKTAGFLLAK